MPPKVVTEIRFREGTGERYLNDGRTVRCQALSKGRIRKWREANDDYETPTDELFPACQCFQPAIPGTYACYWHGGMTPGKNSPKDIFDVMPLDLGEKLKSLMAHPEYISQRQNINLLEARKWELLESIQLGLPPEEAWGMVADALFLLKQAKLTESEKELEEALKSQTSRGEAWKEIRQLDKIINQQKTSEVKNAKELKLMATADQVAALLSNIYSVIEKSVEKYFTMDYIEGYGDKRAQADFLHHVADTIYKSSNTAPVTLQMLETGEK